MKVEQFDFDLPRERIAVTPASPRDTARLLHIYGTARADYTVADLPDLLRPSDLMIFNDTKVIPARLYGKRGEASVEVTLHKAIEATCWQVFAKPAKRLREGDSIHFAEDFTARVERKLPSGEVVIRFEVEPSAFHGLLLRYGAMPLPPYIERDRAAGDRDKEHYQTIYARHEGAVAAPTAGLHFTESLLKKLAGKGIETDYVTLHVGAGTFLPVKTDTIHEHVMHYERAYLSEKTAARINTAKRQGRRIVAVGTTSLRTLEAATDEAGVTHAFSEDTNLFITPGYRFRCVDVLMTNFHLPKSTLFMLVSAFCGLATMKAAYAHAIETHYRFYSYGDACLLEKHSNG